MNQILKDIFDLFDLELNDWGIKFKVKIGENLGLLSTDQRRLMQILINIVSNSI